MTSALPLEGVLTVLRAPQAMYKSYGSCRELMELRNLTSVGELILMSALQRRGSCGGHYCVDEPAGAVCALLEAYSWSALYSRESAGVLGVVYEGPMRAPHVLTACERVRCEPKGTV